MDVQRAVARCIEQGWRQESAVRRDDQRVGRERPDLLDFARRFEAWGLKDRDAARRGIAFDRAFSRTQAATGGTIRLGEDQDNLVARRHEGRQSPLSELGRAGED